MIMKHKKESDDNKAAIIRLRDVEKLNGNVLVMHESLQEVESHLSLLSERVDEHYDEFNSRLDKLREEFILEINALENNHRVVSENSHILKIEKKPYICPVYHGDGEKNSELENIKIPCKFCKEQGGVWG